MASLAEVYATVLPDTDRFEPQLKRDLAKVDGDKHGRDVGRRTGDGVAHGFGGSLAKLGSVFAGGLAAIGAVNLVKDIFGEASEAREVGAITANAIKVTGGAAQVTAQQVEELSTAISNKTGIDDEQVQSGANLLLTFKNVRNELGAGNDVFSKATALAQDLSKAGFGDADTAAKMLGKALNDPVAGLTALGKAGVTFSADQKEQIKGFVAANDLLSAQKIILGEVESQVGGAAEATATPMQKLGTTVNNLKETIGTALLPILDKAATFLGERLPQAVTFLTNLWNNDLLPALKAFKNAFLWDEDPNSSNGLSGIMENLGYWARQTFDFFKAEVLPRLREFGDYVATTIVPLLRDAFAKALDAAKQAFNNVRDAIERNRPELEDLYQKFKTVAQFVAENVIPIIGFLLRRAFETLGPIIGYVIDRIGDSVNTFNDLRNIAGQVASAVGTAWETMRKAAESAWNWIKRNVVDPLISGFGKVKEIIDDLSGPVGAIADGFKRVGSFLGFGSGGRGGPQSAFGTTASGSRQFPLPGGPGAYRVTQGPHPVNAIDYGAPVGTPVFASFSGLLTTTDLGNRSYGKYFRLQGNGNPILGAHLSGFARGSGPVSQGALIGWTGTTGNSTGPHLHLENFDLGGLLRPGWNVVRNDTGKMERVAPVFSTPGRGSGATVVVNVSGSVVTERDLVRVVRDGLGRLSGRGDPVPV